MNTPNNKRKKDSQEKIEKTFVELIQTREINQISVTDICKRTNLNRTTFYSNYTDIYNLADKIKEKMVNDFFNIYAEEKQEQKHSYNFLKLFKHIKENQIFYKTYFKLNFDLESDNFLIDEKEFTKYYDSINNIQYHIEFFKAGINAIIKKRLYNGYKETPEEMFEIIKTEYKKN